MTRLADIQAEQIAKAEIKASLLGRKCWYAYAGFGNTPRIVLGRKLPRGPEELAVQARLAARRAARGVKTPKEDALTRTWIRSRGDSELLIWCSWRLDDANGPATSSDDNPERCEAAIRQLIGHTVRAVDIAGLWDLRIVFNGGFVLSALPDHVGPEASFDGNWEVWRPEQAYLIGTDLTCKVIDPENRPMQLAPRRGRWKVASGPKSSK